MHLLAAARCARASPLAPIPALPPLHPGDVIEIQGPAASGKTHLLYHILLAHLAPVSTSARPEIAAVVYDTDASFDILRFRHLLLSRLPSDRDPHESVRRSLARLHLFRPTSSVQLAASIANLPAYHASHMPNQEIAVLAIDSVSAFHWPDRFSSEQSRPIGPDTLKPAALPPLHHVWSAIRRVRSSILPLVVLTNWALYPASPPSETSHKQHLHSFQSAERGAKDSVDTDPASPSPFHLAHHISLLSPPSSDPLPALPLDDPLLHDPRHRRGIGDNRQVRCVVTSSGTRDIVRFAFQVTDDHILVRPQDSFEPTLQNDNPLLSF